MFVAVVLVAVVKRTMAVTGTPPLLLLTTFYLLLILISSSHQCGPGRNYGTRKARKMTPLVFKQHVPNVSENTLGASGPSEGRITRQDPRWVCGWVGGTDVYVDRFLGKVGYEKSR